MRVHGEEEWDEQVMRVPKCLIALLPNLCMSRRVHEQHAQQHDMPSNATSLRIVNLHGRFRSDHRALDIEEVDVVRSGVHNGPEK